MELMSCLVNIESTLITPKKPNHVYLLAPKWMSMVHAIDKLASLAFQGYLTKYVTITLN
jgi:hypothetical protein